MTAKRTNDPEVLASVFEERAENLSAEELKQWTAVTDRDRQLLAKLKGPGAKLLTGPRGSGKSTLLRQAYFELIDTSNVLAVYVNYSRSLALEPLFHRQANATKLFRQWVLVKIVQGVRGSIIDAGRSVPADIEARATEAEVLIRSLETGDDQPTIRHLTSPSELLMLLENWTHALSYKRCVLLLDDAAHAFSAEQQSEFFEIFRELKSRIVSAKAAVYPGVTSYSPNFHVGHDAELVEAWYSPEDPEYLETMRDIVRRRLPEKLRQKLAPHGEFVDFLALASFGLPRGFLVMLSQLLGVEEETSSKPSRAGAELAVSRHVESVRNLFTSLSKKLPRFKHFIEVGKKLEISISETLYEYNQDRPINRKAVIIAISDPLVPELDRILAFFEYAGLVRKLETVSRGESGLFHRYAVHYSILIANKTLNLSRQYSLTSLIEALSTRNAHSFARTKSSKLLSRDMLDRCTLDLAPCKKCGAPRASDDAQFCMKCGNRLVSASIYETLLRTSVDELTLTDKKVAGLKAAGMKTVQDILLDEERHQLLAIPRIGPVWAARIRNSALEFVGV